MFPTLTSLSKRRRLSPVINLKSMKLYKHPPQHELNDHRQQHPLHLPLTHPSFQSKLSQPYLRNPANKCKKKELLIALAATQTHVGPPTPQFSKKQGCSTMPQHHFPFPSITVPEAGGWLRSPCMNKATSFSFGACMQKRDRVNVHEPGAVLPKKVNGKGEIA